MIQTLDQTRAKAAWEATAAADVDKEYVSLCSGAPVMILTNGLGPTLAFFLSKAGGKQRSDYRRLGDALAQWVLPTLDNRAAPDSDMKAEHLMQKITQVDAEQYRMLTHEALAYLNWLKRFAVATKPLDDQASEDQPSTDPAPLHG